MTDRLWRILFYANNNSANQLVDKVYDRVKKYNRNNNWFWKSGKKQYEEILNDLAEKNAGVV